MDKIDILCYNCAIYRSLFDKEMSMRKYYSHVRQGYDQRAGEAMPLCLNNLGFQRALSKDIKMNRPSGRLDYHILYVVNGEICANGKKLSGGDIYLYLPCEPQVYTYRAGEDTFYYWMHFTGNDIEAQLKKMGIFAGAHRSNGKKRDADTLLRLIYDLLVYGESKDSPHIISLFRAFLELVGSERTVAHPFSKAVSILEENENKSISDIAAAYNMTAEHFIRSFRAEYGVTPQRYRSEHRLNQSKMLLFDTKMSISEIAMQCGFEDPLYFSKIFKKRFGISPSEFRKNAVI